MANAMRVALVQQFFPAYRAAVFSQLASHPEIELTLIHAASESVGPDGVAVRNVMEPMPFRVVSGPMRSIRLGSRSLLWHTAAVDTMARERFDVVIHPLEVRWASLGRIRRLQHRRGGKFVLWGIGFAQKPERWLDRYRLRLVHQADATIFYGDRNRQRYIAMGVAAEKLFVARNSVSIRLIDDAVAAWQGERLHAFRRAHRLDEGPILVTVGRLVPIKRLDLLLRAIVRLRPLYSTMRLVIIGDGPEEEPLRDLTAQLGLRDRVIFAGAIRDDEALAPWFLASDLVVAPGQIGLLATHAHAYGRPVITSDNPEMHGPEVEILVPGQTGLLYPFGDEKALAGAIQALLADRKKRQAFGVAAYRQAHEGFGVVNMVNGFVTALAHVTGRPMALMETFLPQSRHAHAAAVAAAR